eukprot:COSAG02_NODE_23712_length_710_cov_1.121113_1_plen_22_part_10
MLDIIRRCHWCKRVVVCHSAST